MNLQANIRDWYLAATEDEIGNEIKKGATFQDLFDALQNFKKVEEILGGDSDVRDTCFYELARLLGINADLVFTQWELAAKAKNNPFLAR